MRAPEPERVQVRDVDVVQREDAPSASSCSRPSKLVVSEGRKSFFAALRVPGPTADAGAEQTELDELPATQSQSSSVRFTLEGLLEFRDTVGAVQNTKTAAEVKAVHRKRPNYNGAKRKLLARVDHREKPLDLKLVVCRYPKSHLVPSLSHWAHCQLIHCWLCFLSFSVSCNGCLWEVALCSRGLVSMVPAGCDWTVCKLKNLAVATGKHATSGWVASKKPCSSFCVSSGLWRSMCKMSTSGKQLVQAKSPTGIGISWGNALDENAAWQFLAWATAGSNVFGKVDKTADSAFGVAARPVTNLAHYQLMMFCSSWFVSTRLIEFLDHG